MIIGVDTGGTKTLVAAFSHAGTIVDSIKFPTPELSSDYVAQLVSHIKSLQADTPLSIISLALPNIGKNRQAPNSSFQDQFSHLKWKNFDAAEELRSHFPGTKIIAANDANLGALGEVRLMDKPPKRVLYATISTGIGTGVVINGSIDNDFSLSEGGHLLLEYDGILRDWDQFGSGKAVHDMYDKYASEITSKRSWKQIVSRMSRGFYSLVPIVQPDLIIIGGSMGTHFEKFGGQLQAVVNERLPKVIAPVTFVPAIHPEEAVIYGCYFYAIDHTQA